MEVSNLARSIINLRAGMVLEKMLLMVLLVGLFADDASGKLQAQGKYEMLATPNKNTDERSIVDNMKMLFGAGSNRAPAHDTPASSCSCRNAYVGTNGTATGWGTLKEDGKPSCVLQEVEVPVLSNE
uniref:Peptidase S1 domain-containing protein n=1 Tax=Anopheles epiroticus TaxID=199890 RepID=A0A182PQT2_9DIPT